MALRLVRQTSDIPNITNKDDVVMTRYAYGGYNGIVKAFGNECGYTADNGIFKVLDGKIVIDGWEIEIDGAGWTFNVSNISGVQYQSIYAEINVLTETVKLDSTYLTGSYPEIDKGDDLTEIPNGTARLLLYNVRVENGAITEVIKRFEIIPYLTQKVLDLEKELQDLDESLIGNGKPLQKYDESKGTIEERLTRLGFKSGVIKFLGVDYGSEDYSDTTQNGIYRLGNFVFCRIVVSGITLSDNTLINYLRKGKSPFVIAENFTPAYDVHILTFINVGDDKDSGERYSITIKPDGSNTITEWGYFGNGLNFYGEGDVVLNFGYEAPHITE